jgi:hypothetical protein
VPLAQASPGDLVYLQDLEASIRHIALVIENQEPTVAHASRTRGVTIEPLAELLKRYRFKAATRLAPP